MGISWSPLLVPFSRMCVYPHIVLIFANVAILPGVTRRLRWHGLEHILPACGRGLQPGLGRVRLDL